MLLKRLISLRQREKLVAVTALLADIGVSVHRPSVGGPRLIPVVVIHYRVICRQETALIENQR